MSEIAARLDAARESLQANAAGPEYLTVPEAAQLARCNPKTIRRAVIAGHLRAFRPAHRMLLRQQDVRSWVESRAAVPSPSARPRQRRGRRSPPGSVAALRAMEQELTR